MIPYPSNLELAPAYLSYYIKLIEPSENLIQVLEDQREKMMTMIRKDPPPNFRYAENKWTIRQSLIHMIDTERIFAYRILCFARGENIVLPGFDQDVYADNDFLHLRLKDIGKEYKTNRQSTIRLLKNLSPKTYNLQGRVSDYSFTVDSFAYAIAGHERHHIQLFEDKYGWSING